jgi:hypothetical protein
MLVVQLFYQRPGIRCGQPSEQRQVLFDAQQTFLAVCEFAVQVIVVVITHRRMKPPLARRRRRSAPASFHRPATNRPGLFREPGRHDLHTVQRKGRQACSPPWLEKGRTHSTSRQASWLPVIVTGYSCGTALDLHQLPPLCPGIRACGSPRWYLLGKSIKMIAYLHQACK